MTGAEFRAARKALGLTQEQVAAELCVGLRTVVRVEQMGEVPKLWSVAIAALGNNPAMQREAMA